MNKICYAALCALSVSAACNASALSEPYVSLGVGGARSTSIDLNRPFLKDSKKIKLKSGISSSVGAGVKITDHLRAEIAYNRVDGLKLEHNYKIAPKLKTGNALLEHEISLKQKPKLQSGMLNLYYDIDLPYFIKPFIGVGVGYAHIQPGKFTWTTKSIANGKSNESVMEFSTKGSSNFSYALTAGASFEITEELNIDLGYKFQDFGKINQPSSLSSIRTREVNYTNFGKQDEKKSKGSKIKIHSLNIGVRHSF